MMIRSREAPLHEIAFRRLAASDYPMFTAWLNEPHVRRFYQKQPATIAAVADEYGPAVRGEEPTICHLALADGAPYAYLQSYRNADYPEWVDIVGVQDGFCVDLFIGDPAWLGRGFGQLALREYVRRVAFPHHAGETRAYIGHALDNSRALKCSQAVGFRPLRQFVEDGVETMLLAVDRSELEAAG
jgi:aminoglycoside 6'-N-acetyltransferase